MKVKFFLLIGVGFFFRLNAQVLTQEICLGGSGDDFLNVNPYYNYDPNYYKFNTNDGGTLFFGLSNSHDGIFSPNKGYADIIVIKLSAQGNILFTKNLGSAYQEHYNFIVTRNSDSSKFFIFTESFSNDSFYSEFIGNINIEHKLKCIDQNADSLWENILSTELFYQDEGQHHQSPHYENQVNLYTDENNKTLAFFEKAHFDTVIYQRIIDSLFYFQVDENGSTVWNKVYTPAQLVDTTHTISDTFFDYSLSFSNEIVNTSQYYFSSAYVNIHNVSSGGIYRLNYTNGDLDPLHSFDSLYAFHLKEFNNKIFIMSQLPNDNAAQGDVFIYYALCDEDLHITYQNRIPYHDPETFYNHNSYFSYNPLFDKDSSNIWLDTRVATLVSFGWFLGIHYYFYAHIIDASSGAQLHEVDLNANEPAEVYLVKSFHRKFYYVSSKQGYNRLISYYENGDVAEEKILDTINQNLVYRNISYGYNSDNFSNDFFLPYFIYDSVNRPSLGVTILDSNLFSTHNFRSNILSSLEYYIYVHAADKNTFSLLYNTIHDTSGCYNGTKNILYQKYSVLTNISNHFTEAIFSIYPNPASGSFILNFTAPGNFPLNVSIYDITGKLAYMKSLFHMQHTHIELSDSNLPTGLYTIQLTGDNEIWNKKIVIQKP